MSLTIGRVCRSVWHERSRSITTSTSHNSVRSQPRPRYVLKLKACEIVLKVYRYLYMKQVQSFEVFCSIDVKAKVIVSFDLK